MADENRQDERVGIGSRLPESEEATLIRFEETVEARAGGWRGVGFLRARKRVEAVKVDETVSASHENVNFERVPVADGDPGGVETLPDGGVSIPVYEEQLVVTKRVVLKERVVIRKRITEVVQPVRAELRRERVEIDVDEDVRDRVELPEEWSEHERSDS
jgi:uncharacterized protein (TIGR02271 family)